MCVGAAVWVGAELLGVRNGIKDVNLNRLLFICINERILNRPTRLARRNYHILMVF